jgi:hypothetical protein
VTLAQNATAVSSTAPNSGASAVSGDVQRFITANRIHIAPESYFIDRYLTIHPRELAEENQPVLRDKLKLAFSLHHPSFYESSVRFPIALGLASLLPVSHEARRQELLKTIDTFNRDVKTGSDSELAQTAAERAAPFAAIVNALDQPEYDNAIGVENLKNGLTFYLLVREALTRRGYTLPLAEYVTHKDTGEQILASLKEELNIAPSVVMETARTGGIKGVSHALGIDDAYLHEVETLVKKVSKERFSYNTIEHWHIGRQLLKDTPDATMETKIVAGAERRIHDTLHQLQAKFKGRSDVPEAAKRKEQWVADGLKLLPDIQRQLLWDLGYEIGYTDAPTADKIAFHQGVYGLHTQIKDMPRDVRGTYHIYFGSHGDPEMSRRTFVHEVTHNLWPSLFNAEEVKQIDALANRDRMRLQSITTVLESQFETFKSFVDDYHKASATPEAKQQALARANQHFASTLGDISALITENKDAYQVLHMCEQANERLHIDGALYTRSNYHEPTERMREVISRFSELRYVRLREQPALMQFIAPGLTKIYDNYYLPHLEHLHAEIVNGQTSPQRIQTTGAASPRIAIAAANDNVSAATSEEIPPSPISIPNSGKGNSADSATDEPENNAHPSTHLMANTPRQICALQALKDMGVRPPV